VHENVFGYDSLGAHIGKSINREDADFAMLTTHALVVLLTKKSHEVVYKVIDCAPRKGNAVRLRSRRR
jgi:ABC-type dipeptide/oligopeptide/nickel transport system permease component